jgi:8-oxo-dGTP pyrophosphatase MutT (NUDIX family)
LWRFILKSVAAIGLIHDGKILMGRRRDNGKWTNPGGHLNKGENPLDGALREVLEETGIELHPNQLTKLEEKIVTKKDGEKIKVWAYQANLVKKPPTTMKIDPDEEVQRWHWVSLSKDLDHIKDELHVPFEDNIILKNVVIPENKSMAKMQKFWAKAGKMGREGFMDEVSRLSKKDEIPQAIFSRKRDNEKRAGVIPGGESEGIPEDWFPKDQIAKGVKVEAEHTGNKEVAKEIPKDHLAEKSKKKDDIEKNKYYDYLDAMEKKMEKSAFWRGFAGRKPIPNPEGARWFKDFDDIDHVQLAMHLEEKHPHLSKFEGKRWDEIPTRAKNQITKIKESGKWQ